MRLRVIIGIVGAEKKVMKLPRVSYRRNLMLIYLIISILFSLTMVNVPVKSVSDGTRLYVRESPPGSWMPGVAVNGWVWVTVDIESPLAWDNTADGIVGWVFSVRVDPDVLTPWSVATATFGYFLYDFCDWYGYTNYTLSPPALISAANGTIIDFGEAIAGFETLGVGAGGSSYPGSAYGSTYGLGRLRFRSLSATAHTLIDIYDASWVDINGTKHDFDVVDDGHYNQPPPSHTLTVESTPIDGINFTIDTTYTTNTTVELAEGNYTVTMPSTWNVGLDKYYFRRWEDDSTSPVRTISLTSNKTINAIYELKLVPPIASYTFSPTEPIVAETVTFNASDSYDPDGTIVSYEWDFGDGAFANGVMTSHSYADGGLYTVTLTITDNDGLTDTATAHITVIHRMLSVELSGEFDYLLREFVRIKIAALVMDATTMEPVSNANVTIQIYDDNDNLWISSVMTESPAGTGIYIWASNGTIKELRLTKGIYLVRVEASFRDSPTAYDILLFHIDPPAEGTNETLYYIALTAIISATATGLILKRQQIIKRLRRLMRTHVNVLTFD